jgi:hypothetical protein
MRQTNGIRCSLLNLFAVCVVYPEDGSGRFLGNVRYHSQNCVATQCITSPSLILQILLWRVLHTCTWGKQFRALRGIEDMPYNLAMLCRVKKKISYKTVSYDLGTS